eukprot:2631917-Prymnesium_polylepis.1
MLPRVIRFGKRTYFKPVRNRLCASTKCASTSFFSRHTVPRRFVERRVLLANPHSSSKNRKGTRTPSSSRGAVWVFAGSCPAGRLARGRGRPGRGG